MCSDRPCPRFPALRRPAHLFILSFCAGCVFLSVAQGAPWQVVDGANTEAPGRKVDITNDGQLVARLIYGEGQMKPYLHVYGTNGDLLTNSGLDSQGKTSGQFPHHRGIFIGWKINSDLGTWDLWHMTAGAHMDLVQLEKAESTDTNATLVARIEWHAGKKDDSGSSLLLTETRRLVFSRTGAQSTIVDTKFSLQPARDLKLVGDLQHSGIHFRAHNEVNDRQKETAYVYEPDGVVKGEDLKWCRLTFPRGDRWYTALELNAPANPMEELSMRAYGRFGYFFKKPLMAGQPLDLAYRFVVEETKPPSQPGQQPPEEEIKKSREKCEQQYKTFVGTLGRGK